MDQVPAAFRGTSIPPRNRQARIIARVASAATIVVAACASYAPVPLDPLAEYSALTRRAADATLDAGLPARAAWFPLQTDVRFGDGLDLAEANTLALFFSPEIRRARSAAGVTGAEVLRAGLLANPELFLGPRISTEGSGLIFPAWLAWELPLWGKEGAEKALAAARHQAANVAVLEVELRVLSGVRSGFVTLALLTEQQTALQALGRDAEHVVTWVEELNRAGEADDVTLFLARLDRDDAVAIAVAKTAERESEHRDLLAAIGLLPDAAVQFVLEPDPSRLPELPEPAIEQLLRYPELQAAQAEYEASEAALRLELTEQYPRVRLGPEFEDDRGDASVGIGVGITLPLFDQNRGGIAAAEARRTETRERYQNLLLAACHTAARTRAEWQAVEHQLETYRAGAARGVDAAMRALDVRLRSGRANVLEVLAARRAAASARLRETELRQRAAIARLRNAVASGVVLNDPPPPEPESEVR